MGSVYLNQNTHSWYYFKLTGHLGYEFDFRVIIKISPKISLLSAELNKTRLHRTFKFNHICPFMNSFAVLIRQEIGVEDLSAEP